MTAYRYKALDAAGSVQKGLMEAAAPQQVRQLLRSAGLVPLAVEDGRQRCWSLPLAPSRTQRFEVALLPAQLATLLESGVPLTRAVEVMSRNVSARALRHALDQSAEAIRHGQPLSAALGQHERFFDRAFVSMVAAGEASGELAASLWQLAEYKEAELETQSRLSGALTYPLFVGGVGLLVCGFLVVFVIPKIARVLQAGGRKLPMLTEALLAAGEFLRDYWWGLLIIAALLAAALLHLRKGERTAARLDLWKLRLPVVGPVLAKAMIARWARMFAVLLRSGLTVSESLEVLEEMTENRAFRRELSAQRRRIEGGGGLTGSEDEETLMPPLVRQMLAVGEGSGEMDRVLDHLARVYSRECDVFSRRVLALLEPLLIVILGGCILVVILAVLAPILEMNRIL